MRQYVFNPFTGKFDIIDVAENAEQVVPVPFLFNTPSPMLLQQVPAGSILNRCTILIAQPFDDHAAFLKLGTTATPDLVFGQSDVTLGALGNCYDQSSLFQFSIMDFLQLTISPGASTQGAGLLLYKLR
jgi:hypothetical protein